IRPIENPENFRSDSPERTGRETEFNGSISFEVPSLFEAHASKPLSLSDPSENRVVAAPKQMNPTPHGNVGGLLEFQREPLQPTRAREMSVVSAPDGTLGRERLFVEDSAHERIFENISRLDEELDVPELIGIFSQQVMRGGFDVVQSGA